MTVLVQITAQAPAASVMHADNLTTLAVEVGTEVGRDQVPGKLGKLGRVEGDHVWLDIESLRRAAAPHDRATWQDDFDAMLEYARFHGWTDPEASVVRAHITWLSDTDYLE
jgi:hypothetical protein